MAARDNILARIRAAHGRASTPTLQERDTVSAYIRAHSESARPQYDWNPVERFCDRALTLSSTWSKVPSRADVPRAIAAYLDDNSLPRNAVCWPEFQDLEWQAAGVRVEAREAHGDDPVGITGAYCAIAETGTLMLLSGAQTPAATSLLPETHVAVVHAGRIVRAMEDAWRLLRSEHGAMPRAVNFISGPSRTADIEQTLVLGVHGPCRVHIVVVA
jgi:L-lactate dehydrogenase complex protein LldG